MAVGAAGMGGAHQGRELALPELHRSEDQAVAGDRPAEEVVTHGEVGEEDGVVRQRGPELCDALRRRREGAAEQAARPLRVERLLGEDEPAVRLVQPGEECLEVGRVADRGQHGPGHRGVLRGGALPGCPGGRLADRLPLGRDHAAYGLGGVERGALVPQGMLGEGERGVEGDHVRLVAGVEPVGVAEHGGDRLLEGADAGAGGVARPARVALGQAQLGHGQQRDPVRQPVPGRLQPVEGGGGCGDVTDPQPQGELHVVGDPVARGPDRLRRVVAAVRLVQRERQQEGLDPRPARSGDRLLAPPVGLAAEPRLLAGGRPGQRDEHVQQSELIARRAELDPDHQLDCTLGDCRAVLERPVLPHVGDRGLELGHRRRDGSGRRPEPGFHRVAGRGEAVAERLHPVSGTGRRRASASSAERLHHDQGGLELLGEPEVFGVGRVGEPRAEDPFQPQQGVGRKVEARLRVGDGGVHGVGRHLRVGGDELDGGEEGDAGAGRATHGLPGLAAALEEPTEPDAPAAAAGLAGPCEQLRHRALAGRVPAASEVELVGADDPLVDVGDHRVDRGQVERGGVPGSLRQVPRCSQMSPPRLGVTRRPSEEGPAQGERRAYPRYVSRAEGRLRPVPGGGGGREVGRPEGARDVLGRQVPAERVRGRPRRGSPVALDEVGEGEPGRVVHRLGAPAGVVQEGPPAGVAGAAVEIGGGQRGPLHERRLLRGLRVLREPLEVLDPGAERLGDAGLGAHPQGELEERARGAEAAVAVRREHLAGVLHRVDGHLGLDERSLGVEADLGADLAGVPVAVELDRPGAQGRCGPRRGGRPQVEHREGTAGFTAQEGEQRFVDGGVAGDLGRDVEPLLPDEREGHSRSGSSSTTPPAGSVG